MQSDENNSQIIFIPGVEIQTSVGRSASGQEGLGNQSPIPSIERKKNAQKTMMQGLERPQMENYRQGGKRKIREI